MRGFEDGKSEHLRGEDSDDLAHVGGKKELNCFSYIAVNSSAFLNSGNYCGKVVVGKHHVRYILCNVSTCNAHSDADVGALDGGRVIDSVARHSGNAAVCAPGIDYPYLVLGLNAGVDRIFFNITLKLFVADRIKLCSGNGKLSLAENTKLTCNSGSGVLVVARYHYGAYTCPAAFLDRGGNFGTHRVDHSGKPEEYKPGFHRGRLVFSFRGGVIPAAAGGGKHAQRLVSHCLVCGGDLLTELGSQLDLFPSAEYMRAVADNHIGRAGGVLDVAVSGFVYGGHHFSAGVKGDLPDARLFGFKLIFWKPQLCGIVHHRGLRGVAH